MKKLLFMLIASISILFADIYDDVARNFIIFNGKSSTIISREPLKFKDKVVGYLFELDRGYILVSKAKSASPIKAYSFKNNYKQLPKAYQEFILRDLYSYASINTREVRGDIAKRWDFLANYKKSLRGRVALRESPILIKTHWNQYQPYNKFLPAVNGENAVTGCVQVAMAQIMAYWKYPKMGKSKIVSDIKVYNRSGSYVRTDRLTAHLHRKFGWGIMPINGEKAESYQQDAVAYLFRDILISNRAEAGIAGTGTAINIDSLIKNFGYSKNISQMSSDNPNFKATIHNQIDSKMPILVMMNGVSNAGHMAIIDGYKDDNTGNYVHMNLGWGGLSDDYYNLDKDNKIGSYKFSKSMSIYYNIKPCSASSGDCFVNLERGDSISGDNGSYKISGKFNQERDADEYQVYLKGRTTIYGTRGYNNQGFYISIFNSKGELIADDDKEIFIKDLKPGLYTLRISLVSAKSGRYYPLGNNPKFYNYEIDVDSDHLTQSEIQSISGNQNSLYIGNLRDIVISKPTKLFIYAYSDNDSNNPTLSANYDSSKIALSVDNQNSLISIKPKGVKSLSSVKVNLRGSNTRDNNSLVSKNFNVITYDKPIYFGKDFSYTGKFSGSYDEKSQDVILNGTCRISGYRSYYSNIYYFKLLTKNGADITDLKRDKATVSNLRFDRYKILSKANGIYDDKSSYYSVYVKCANANYSIDRVAKLLGVSRDSNGNTNTKTDDSTNSKTDDSTKTGSQTNTKTDDSTKTDTSTKTDDNNNNSNGNSCAQVITHAYNPQTGEEKDFNTPCDVPKGWVVGRAPDFDGDGINDIKDSDDDNDGISDIDENRYGLNPKDPSDANIDSDGDGFSNIDEINSGTNPKNINSYPNSNPQDTKSKWRAFVSSLNGYREDNENPSDFIENGYMRIEPSLSDTDYYWTNFQLDIPEGLDGDNIKFEARVKCSSQDGGISAYDTTLRVKGSDGSAWVTLMDGDWAKSYDSFGAGGTPIKAIPELVKDLQNWHTIAVQTRDGKVSVYYDNKLIKEAYYSGSVGEVTQLEIQFKGSGTVDWTRLYQNDELVMVDDFDKDGDATVTLYPDSNDNGCTQSITHAYNSQTGEEKDFNTPCDVPKGWIVGKAPDFDGDGINDIKDSDDDNDGISDIDENRYGLNPKDPSDANIDSDGDGFSNIDEINSGTNPKDSDSYPENNQNITHKKAVPNDFNGDGISDIFIRLGANNYILYMDAYGDYKQRRIRPLHPSFKVAGIGDFNGDGISDILWRRVHRNIIWYMRKNGTFAQRGLRPIHKSFKVAGIGDFNGDGISDILWRRVHRNIIWYMRKNGTFAQRGLRPIHKSFKVAGIGDFNGDGISDILFRRGVGNYILYIYNNGTSWGGLGNIAKNFKSVGTGDFNGDGISDILWRIGNRYRIWYIMGDGTYGYYTNLISIK